MSKSVLIFLSLSLLTLPAQEVPAASQKIEPIYRVTVVARGVEAINYQYRSAPTKIDFRGTVLLPNAKGEASVVSRPGRTEIDARFENLEPPTRFGREYLTYVLWAISPEGSPHNLGEIITDGSNRARLQVTTDLQAFALIVTAEPYAAVGQPSNVVTVENKARPDTTGTIQTVQANANLLSRPSSTVQLVDQGVAAGNMPKVSLDRYEAILEVYQAQNAIGIARAESVDRYAPEALAKAQESLGEAQRLLAAKHSNTKLVVQAARQATQTAEDARLIAARLKQAELSGAASREADSASSSASGPEGVSHQPDSALSHR